jgi:threonyl-tRNA synthetase
MHADFIEYRPVKKEIPAAEEIQPKSVREEEIVVLFTAFEKGDEEELIRKAVSETRVFLTKLGTKRVMIYPFAHLSQDLARPSEAFPLLLSMEREAVSQGLEVVRAPFGWTKALQIKVKGHPLAEMSRSYSLEVQAEPAILKTRREPSEHEMLARIRKSDFGQLPETDHRSLGEKLDLFSFQEPSPGMVYWHDKGLKLRNLLIDFIRAELAKRGYTEISSPALANTMLWRVSGHWDHYRSNMFLTRLGDEEMGLKPMNCPSTFLVYKSRRWSFRDLPIRYSIFDPLYRNELSGVATGLFRVKILTQDDAHIIATDGQAESELSDMLDLMQKLYDVFDLEYKVKISTRPDESMGSDEEWERATKILTGVVESKGLAYQVKAKEGNFYAPKIDVDIKDSLGREWQCGTFQLDLQMPKQFGLTYTGSDGKEHTPVVLHRTIFGSLERFIGILLEHYQGKLPIWLSPVQARVLPLTDDQVPYAKKVLSSLLTGGLRVEGDFEHATLNAKVRDAQLQKIPYVVVVGGKEEATSRIAVRTREGKQQSGIRVDDFLAEVKLRSDKFE